MRTSLSPGSSIFNLAPCLGTKLSLVQVLAPLYPRERFRRISWFSTLCWPGSGRCDHLWSDPVCGRFALSRFNCDFKVKYIKKPPCLVKRVQILFLQILSNSVSASIFYSLTHWFIEYFKLNSGLDFMGSRNKNWGSKRIQNLCSLRTQSPMRDTHINQNKISIHLQNLLGAMRKAEGALRVQSQRSRFNQREGIGLRLPSRMNVYCEI